jgi:hypothetical protein
MAWRIEEHVLRGEIDNRRRGVVTGRLWLDGVDAPVFLELQGDASADLAGRLLEFVRLASTRPITHSLAPIQRGIAGRMSAAVQMRVMDVSIEDACRLLSQGSPIPSHAAASLCLEWMDETNGPVEINSADFKLTLSAPVWQWDETKPFNVKDGFMRQVDLAIEEARQQVRAPKPIKESWDE